MSLSCFRYATIIAAARISRVPLIAILHNLTAQYVSLKAFHRCLQIRLSLQVWRGSEAILIDLSLVVSGLAVSPPWGWSTGYHPW